MRKLWSDPSFVGAFRKAAQPIVAAAAPARSAGAGGASVNGVEADQKAVTRRLAVLVDPYKKAMAEKGPNVGRVQTLMTAVKTDIARRDFAQASKDLDQLEPLLAPSGNGALPKSAASPTGDSAASMAGDPVMASPFVQAGGVSAAPSRAIPPDAERAAPTQLDELPVLPLQSIMVRPTSSTIAGGGGTKTFKAEGLDSGGTPVDVVVVWSSNDPAVEIDPVTGIATAREAVSVTATIRATHQDSGVFGEAKATVVPPPASKAPRPEPKAPPGGSAPGEPDAALDATITDMFFAKASPNLTPMDEVMLRAYASAYLAAKISEPIVVEGYASREGAEGFNKTLSKQRADSVAEFLKNQGVPKDKVVSKPRGVTSQFSKDELRPNRRATLKPPPPTEGPSIAVKNDAPRQEAVVRPITISPKISSMDVGQGATFEAYYSDAQPGDVGTESPTVAWSSSKPDVVMINNDSGNAKALKAGTAEITATDMSNLLPEGAGRDSISIKVSVPGLKWIRIASDESRKIHEGMLHHMSALALYDNGKLPTDVTKEAVWASDDVAKVIIVENGVAKGQKKLGTAKITASYAGFVGSADIKVIPMPDVRPRTDFPKGPGMDSISKEEEERTKEHGKRYKEDDDALKDGDVYDMPHAEYGPEPGHVVTPPPPPPRPPAVD
jgi:outer membrane protein OmpA-like peptidoglycan-associated protein